MGTSIYKINYKERRSLQIKIRKVFLYLIIIILGCTLSTTFLCFSCRVVSSSMQPTLEKNEWVVITPLAVPDNPLYFKGNPIDRGDLVYMRSIDNHKQNLFFSFLDKFIGFFTFQQYYPFSNSKYMSENKLIRRVIAFPGEKVYIKDYVAFIKTEGAEHFLTEFELSSHSYDIITDKEMIDKSDNLSFFMNCEEITLGEGEYFVLCDNRTSTLDSRAWGAINKKKICGKVLLRDFPPNKMKLF